MKRLLTIFIIAAALLTLASCAKKEEPTLTVGIMPDFDSIPFAVAQLEGYLPGSIELLTFMSPMERDAALYGGEIDGTISDMLAVCLMREGGYKAYMVTKTDGCYGVLTASPLDSPRELEAMEIGMSLNTVIEYVTYRVIAEAGGEPDAAERVSIPKIPSRLEMLFAEQIAAVAVPEPYVTAARERGAHVAATSRDLGINPGIMLFMKDSLDNKSGHISALFDAYNKAVEYIKNHEPGDFMPAVIEYLGLPQEALTAPLPDYTEAIAPDEGELLAVQDWLRSKGLIEGEYSYDELFYKVK